jgi:hypothetical protein
MRSVLSFATLLVWTLAGCEFSWDESLSGDMDDGAPSRPGTGDSGDFGGGAPRPPPAEADEAPEPEALRLTKPAATRNFVFVANEVSGNVARVQVDGLAVRIRTARVGPRPTFVRAIPERDSALVLSTGNGTVGLVESLPDGSMQVVQRPVVQGANRLEMTEDGRFGFAFHDGRLPNPSTLPGAISELSALVLGPDGLQTFQISTGVGIRDVRFPGVGRAVILTEDGLATVDVASLAGDRFVPAIPVQGMGPSSALRDLELVVLDDGSTVVARAAQGSGLQVFSLDTDRQETVELPARASDIDGATGGIVVAALRGVDQVAFVDTTADPAEVTLVDVEAGLAGQTAVAGDLRRVVTFSTAPDEAGMPRTRVAIIDWPEATVRVVDVRKPVRDAFISPGGRYAIINHQPPSGSSRTDPLASIAAVSVIDLDDASVRLVQLRAEADELLVTGADEALWIEVPLAGDGDIVRLDLRSFRADTLRLDARPETLGWIPGAGRLYVTQNHPLGRMALIDTDSLQRRELTGYELGSLME